MQCRYSRIGRSDCVGEVTKQRLDFAPPRSENIAIRRFLARSIQAGLYRKTAQSFANIHCWKLGQGFRYNCIDVF